MKGFRFDTGMGYEREEEGTGQTGVNGSGNRKGLFLRCVSCAFPLRFRSYD